MKITIVLDRFALGKFILLKKPFKIIPKSFIFSLPIRSFVSRSHRVIAYVIARVMPLSLSVEIHISIINDES